MMKKLLQATTLTAFALAGTAALAQDPCQPGGSTYTSGTYDAELPFKLYNVPEITTATKKWTDDYLKEQFKPKKKVERLTEPGSRTNVRGMTSASKNIPRVSGACQESTDNFFAFFMSCLGELSASF